MKSVFISFVLIVMSIHAFAATKPPKPEDLKYYRDLTMQVRPEAAFKVPRIGTEDGFSYKLEIGSPIYPVPMVSDISFSGDEKFYRNFWDRIFLKDGSHLLINGEEIPLTCIFISGQDNRYAGVTDPRFPQIIMKVYLVANDYTCVGPLNPSFPRNGGKPESWDTYLYYEIRDPSIMLPAEVKIRYRWNESGAILLK